MKEENQIDSKTLDSSIILAYLFDGKFKDLIENENIFFISVLSIFEIKKRMLERKIPENVIKEKLKFIKEKSISLPLNEEIAEKAAEISLNKNIPAMDSLIYITSLKNNSLFLTLDNDFRGLENVQILEIN